MENHSGKLTPFTEKLCSTTVLCLFSVCDFLGEKIASVLGISTPKYQYAIDEYYRMKKEVCVGDGVLKLFFSLLIFPGIFKSKICIPTLITEMKFQNVCFSSPSVSLDPWFMLAYPWAFSHQVVGPRIGWVLTTALLASLLQHIFKSKA